MSPQSHTETDAAGETAELVGTTEAEIDDLVDTVDDLLDEPEHLNAGTEAGKQARHRAMVAMEPDTKNYQKIAHKINREIRDAIETTLFDRMLDSDEIPAETELTPEAVDRIRATVNEAAEGPVEFVSIDASDAEDEFGDMVSRSGRDDTPTMLDR
jgi:ElaB/YqjD/DUF883 family membrane-anchored ribosome-binding protein